MEYKKLGATGLSVSPLCLGTMSFGRWIDEQASVAILNEALEAGINFIDTANYYGKGQDVEIPYGTGAAEEILGRALKGRRDNVVLATKVGLAMGYGPNDAGSSRVHILREVEASLRRLQTDYIDLYQIHHFDPRVPQEETLRALDDLVRQGKVRYIGCSNYKAYQMAKAHAISNAMNLERFGSVQPQYSLLVRDIESELLPYCQEENVGVIVYSPMARGMLSGKYNGPDDVPPESRAAHGERMIQRLFTPRNFRLIDKLKPIAQQAELPLAEFSLAWVLNQPAVTSAIVGATKTQHVTSAVNALSVKISDPDLKRIDAVTAEVDGLV
ncbi:aldo/keto reductase [Alicyclobacillus tolerans]|uniref:aldo/keto reductase n=1 Tax=Alicyclobacillus tolerans TaxID=90970 RepID=UPI001F1B5DC8|nr:aldo/keto reductase [Alicyclobacillus tolerans]MCF8564255.1 aldo/keto reductase [Alicyclobacillus tolerans]